MENITPVILNGIKIGNWMDFGEGPEYFPIMAGGDPGTAIIGSAALGAAGNLYSGYQQAKSGTAAVNAMNSSNAANQAMYQGMYNQTRSDLMPWMNTGNQANTSIADLMGYNGADKQAAATSAFRSDPGYQFAFNQGQRGLNRSAASKGQFNSGHTGAALVDYGQNMADQQFQNYYNRLFGQSQTGQSAAAQTGSFGMGAATGSANSNINTARMLEGAYNTQGQGYSDMFSGPVSSMNQGLNNYYYAKKMGYIQ